MSLSRSNSSSIAGLGTSYPSITNLSYYRFSSSHLSLLASLIASHEPTTFLI